MELSDYSIIMAQVTCEHGTPFLMAFLTPGNNHNEQELENLVRKAACNFGIDTDNLIIDELTCSPANVGIGLRLADEEEEDDETEVGH